MKPPKSATPAPKPGELSEFEAAVLVGMSPKLLRWLASYAPKQGVDRKLKIRKDGGAVFIDRDELLQFNSWLKLPWPSKDGTRPGIPSGIRTEIREEASGECAMCKKDGAACEAAHIEPVAKSKNNHPENLIWLCSVHHTKFDNDVLGPTDEAREFVVSFKQVMTYYNRFIWQQQANATGKIFSLLMACEALEKQFNAAKTADQVASVSSLLKVALKQVPKTAPGSASDPDFVAFEQMKPQFAALAKSSTKPKDLKVTLKLAASVKSEFATRAGYVECPLCDGSGHYDHEDCPECGGQGELLAVEAREVDLRQYARVDCPLCKGRRIWNGDDCPACAGEGELERRYADQVDAREWDEVECPVCEGARVRHGSDCGFCNGEGRVARRDADRADLRDYRLVDCPLCSGKGTHRGEDCPACHGEQQMEQRFADQIVVKDYDLVQCAICKGRGEKHDMVCRACGGEGRMTKAEADEVNPRDHELVKCPTCKGRGDEYCSSCGGEGRLPKWAADEL